MKKLLTVLLFVLHSLAAWALKPTREYVSTPDSVGLRYRNVTIETPDHVALASWVIEPDSARSQHTTIVLAYGDAGNMSYWTAHARALVKAGYRVVMFDYRGFGHSPDFAIDQQRLYYTEFATDLRAALHYARRQFPQDRIGIMAFSMGTLMATHVAATDRLDFLIGEGYVVDPTAFVEAIKQAKNKVVTLPAEAATYPQLLPRIKCPLLLVAGTQDQHTTVADSVRLVRSARRGQRRELLTFEGGHGAGMYTLSSGLQEFGDLYAVAVQRFIGSGGRRRG